MYYFLLALFKLYSLTLKIILIDVIYLQNAAFFILFVIPVISLFCLLFIVMFKSFEEVSILKNISSLIKKGNLKIQTLISGKREGRK